MPYEVLRTPQVTTALRRMSAREKRSYEAARDALQGEGCRAGGYRLAAVDGDDYPLCCRHLAYAWRMFTAYPDDERIVIVAFDEHDRALSANVTRDAHDQGITALLVYRTGRWALNSW